MLKSISIHQRVLQKATLEYNVSFLRPCSWARPACQQQLASISHTMSTSPTRTTETIARWGKVDTESFREYVDKGYIDIDNTKPGYIESIRVDSRCKRFNARSKLSFRDNFRNTAADLRLERELRGGRASKFFVFCVLSRIPPTNNTANSCGSRHHSRYSRHRRRR